MDPRQVDGFFYGLFMDVAVLRQAGTCPSNVRRAYVDDFALRIGERATLVPSLGTRAYGMLTRHASRMSSQSWTFRPSALHLLSEAASRGSRS
jgi:hypothetical protein